MIIIKGHKYKQGKAEKKRNKQTKKAKVTADNHKQ